MLTKFQKKIAARIGAIKRIKPFVPNSTLLTIFISRVNFRKGLCDKLQKLQHHAACFILPTYLKDG